MLSFSGKINPGFLIAILFCTRHSPRAMEGHPSDRQASGDYGYYHLPLRRWQGRRNVAKRGHPQSAATARRGSCARSSNQGEKNSKNDEHTIVRSGQVQSRTAPGIGYCRARLQGLGAGAWATTAAGKPAHAGAGRYPAGPDVLGALQDENTGRDEATGRRLWL